MIKRISIAILLAALLPSVFASGALAAGGLPDEIVVGEDYTLAEGETLQGNLVVYAGSATLEEDSRVTGDVVIVGGSLEASGEVGGDVVTIGGTATLHETAVVQGDLVTAGGQVSRDRGAEVRGQEVTSLGPRWLPGPTVFRMPVLRWLDLADLGLGAFLRAAGWSLTLGVLALLVLAFWPDQTARVGQTIMSAPLASGAMGLATAITGAAVFTVLILALCLGLLGWSALFAAFLFGWIALGSLVGMRLAPALRLSEANPAVTGALGTFALTLAVEAVRLIPCLGLILAFLLASLGLGAVVLTRFGTRPYLVPPAAPAPTAAPPPPAPIEY